MVEKTKQNNNNNNNNSKTINPKSSDDKCFQYAVTVAFNNQSIKYNPERITKIM